MKKPPTRKLKVFQAQFGFYDSIVAASGQAAALRAWGTHQNLFADGQARVITEAAAVKAALAHPDVPLRRAIGSNAAFEIEPSSLPTIPDAPKRAANATSPQTSRKNSRPKSPAKPPADRSRLDAAQAALRELDEERKREETSLQRRRDELDAQIASAQDRYVEDRKAATTAIVKAREIYRKAGGSGP